MLLLSVCVCVQSEEEEGDGEEDEVLAELEKKQAELASIVSPAAGVWGCGLHWLWLCRCSTTGSSVLRPTQSQVTQMKLIDFTLNGDQTLSNDDNGVLIHTHLC